MRVACQLAATGVFWPLLLFGVRALRRGESEVAEVAGAADGGPAVTAPLPTGVEISC